MKNLHRITRNGSPTYVAPWFKTLTKEGKAMVGQNNIMAPYSQHIRASLTSAEYTYKTAEQFLNECEPAWAMAAE